MKPFEDSIPEEQGKKADDFIILLRQAYRQKKQNSPPEQQEHITRVEERLTRMKEELAERIPGRVTGSFAPDPQHGSVQGKSRARVISILAATLVVCALIGGTVLVFTRIQSSSVQKLVPAGQIGKSVGAIGKPVTVNGQSEGLEMSMSVTPGPYFLGELLAVNLSLTNHTHPTMTLAGEVNIGGCGSSVYPDLAGGTAPYDALYTLPVPFTYSCPGVQLGSGPALLPGQTVAATFYVLLTASGNVTLTGTPSFYLTKTSYQGSPGPLAGHLPVLHLNVLTQIPSDRVFSVQQQGSEVVAQAPTGARLISRTYILCQDSSNHTVPGGYDEWTLLLTHTLQKPSCSEIGNWNITLWKYAVGAVGYAVIQGQSAG